MKCSGCLNEALAGLSRCESCRVSHNQAVKEYHANPVVKQRIKQRLKEYRANPVVKQRIKQRKARLLACELDSFVRLAKEGFEVRPEVALRKIKARC